jgi:hypothetical protein
VMGDKRETRLLWRANNAISFVTSIASPPDNSSPDQKSGPEQQSRGRLRYWGWSLIDGSRRRTKSLEWILFRTPPT